MESPSKKKPGWQPCRHKIFEVSNITNCHLFEDKIQNEISRYD